MTKNKEKNGKMPKYKAVLFDIDNTLFDFDAAEDYALKTSMARRGIAYSEERKGHYLAINRPLWEGFHQGKVDQNWLMVERFRMFGGLYGVEPDPEEWNREYLALLGESSVLTEGAEELLRALRGHCLLAIATNGETAVQKKRLAASPVAGWFDGVFISKEMGLKKPDKAYFDRILETLGVENTQALMVGDNLMADILGANNAEMDSAFFAPDADRVEIPAGVRPTYKITKLQQIKTIIWGEEL